MQAGWSGKRKWQQENDEWDSFTKKMGPIFCLSCSRFASLSLMKESWQEEELVHHDAANEFGSRGKERVCSLQSFFLFALFGSESRMGKEGILSPGSGATAERQLTGGSHGTR